MQVLQIHTHTWAGVTKSAIIAMRIFGIMKKSFQVAEDGQSIINAVAVVKLRLKGMANIQNTSGSYSGTATLWKTFVLTIKC